MSKTKKFIETIGVIIMLMAIVVFWWETINYTMEDDWFGGESCNVSNIKLQGDLHAYISQADKDENGITIVDAVSSEDLVSAIENAEKDENIKAIILEINSFGGHGVAAEEVANALKRAKKPTAALIREYGNSAAYYAATGADVIFASANSDVGSIGVTISYLDNAKKNEKDGITFNQLSAGKFKDMFNSDKPLAEEERKVIERNLKIYHENFIKAVAENRKMDIEKVRQFADGSSMPGQMALENNLVDKIGGRYEVEEYLKEKIGGEAEICK